MSDSIQQILVAAAIISAAIYLFVHMRKKKGCGKGGCGCGTKKTPPLP